MIRRLLLAVVLAVPAVHAQEDPASAVLDVLAARPHDVSLVAYSLDDPEVGVFVNADVKRPLASTVKLLVLAEYARRVDEGLLDPAERISVNDVEAFYLPGTDGGAHPAAVAALSRQGRLADTTLALDDVAWAMIRFSDNAATDYLLLRFGREAIDALPARLGLRHADPPRPIAGLFLGWDLPRREGESTAIGPNTAADRAWMLAERLRDDPAFRAEMQARMPSLGERMDYDAQAAAALAFPAGTARAYAGLMARLHRGALVSESADARMLALLDWPMDLPVNQAAFDQLAMKGGALPGILTSATLADAKPGADGDPPPMVLALFVEGLPADVWGGWLQSFQHQQFEARLLRDPAFLDAVRERLGG